MVLRQNAKQHQSNHSAPRAVSRPSLRDETAPRKASEYWFAMLATLAVIVFIEWVVTDKTPLDNTLAEADKISQSALVLGDDSAVSSGLLQMLAQKLSTQWPDNNIGQVNDNLLLQASHAAAQQDHQLFADTMRMLGVNAFRNNQIDSAELYFDEALEVFEEIENDMGIASVELLRGELNIKRRAQARRAAYAYDSLQLARWKVFHGQFHSAVEQLNLVVSENLALNRFGAAAAAFQTLYKGYTDNGQQYEAQQAGIEIVKLHSSSGRARQAQSMLASLEQEGLDVQTASELKQASLVLQREYENSVTQMGQARDYQQLYNHFINAGDPVRAWQFRLKSQHSLRGVTQRAMHRQQTGVMALLYNSNGYMKNAQYSLDRARRIYSDNHQRALSEESALLRERVF